MKFALPLSIIFVLTLLASCGVKEQSKTIFTIGSGSKNAMYYPVATALCATFNKYNKDNKTICQAQLSKGAEYNLNAVQNGHFDMGIAQANLQYDAFIGENKFLNKPHKDLRTLFNVHNEYLTIIAKKSSNIHSFSDLRGKSVNIGNPGSGSRILFLQMIKKLGWKLSDFKEVYEESGSNINKVLCTSDKADAAIYIVGHLNKSFQSMLSNCNTELVSLSKSEIATFTSLSPSSFHKAHIPENTYVNLGKVNTFASKTILTASAKLDPSIVKNFVQVLSANKKDLVKKQPSLAVTNFYKYDSLRLAPLHQGLIQ